MATLLAVYLIELSWVKLLGAAYLLYLPYAHFAGGGEGHDRRAPKQAKPMFGLTAFWATVVKVELTDIVFAIDSILVAVAMSNKTWVILTGGVLGIIAMRLVIGKLLALIQTVSGARGRGVHHHCLGGHQAAAGIRPSGRVRALPDSEVAVSRSHRRDLRGRLHVCAKASPRRAEEERAAKDVDELEDVL